MGSAQHPTPCKTNTPPGAQEARHPRRQPPTPTRHLPHAPGAPHMPHTPATHLTITPEHVYINGEPVCAAIENLELSAPTPTDIQTVTLTIIPTTVTILNDDDPDTINAAREAVTRTARDEAGGIRSTYIRPNDLADMLDTWKRHEAARAKHTRATR